MRFATFVAITTVLAGCTLSGSIDSRSAARRGQGNESINDGTVRSGDDTQGDPNQGPQVPIEAIPDQPEVVFLARYLPNNSVEMCSGALVRTPNTTNRRVVLTAKHCFDHGWDNLFAYVGRGTAFSDTDWVPPSRKFFLDRLKVVARLPLADGSTDNSNFNHPGRTVPIGLPFSDISLLILDHDLPKEVVPSEIVRQAPDVHQECTAVGYGNRGGQRGWQRPVQLDLQYVDDYNLVETSQNPQDPTSLTGSGDSGGPLFCQVRGKKVQVGVVSGDFKRPNGQTNTYAYGVYARIDVVYDVIEKVLLAVDAGNTPSPNDVPRQSAPSKP